MLLQTDHDLITYCDMLRGAPAIFLDTEFVGEGRYYPDVGAIQVATPEQAAVVDPLAIQDLTPLFTLLTDPAIEKVFHAASQDLPIFYRLIGAPVQPVFDTQIAAALLGYDEQISFLNLVGRVTGTNLQKSHGFTDWLRRPLTAGQIEYALDDVRYLVPVHAALVKELEARGRMAWAREEFAKLADERRYTPVDTHELYLRIRGSERMRGQALAILRELAAWREETAFANNIPIGRVARDEVLIELARRPRQSVKELYDIRGLAAPQVERFGAGLIEAARHGTATPPPTPQRLAPLPSVLEPTVDFLMLCLRSLSGEQAIAPGMVATRSELVELAQHGPKANISLLRGWRRAAFGEALLATLDGKATARIIPVTRQVHLDWH